MQNQQERNYFYLWNEPYWLREEIELKPFLSPISE